MAGIATVNRFIADTYLPDAARDSAFVPLHGQIRLTTPALRANPRHPKVRPGRVE